MKLLVRWKTGHGPALEGLGPVDEETLTRLLTRVFSSPASRADQLEKTGTLTASTPGAAREVVRVMNADPARTSADTAELLACAAGVFRKSRFSDAVEQLGAAADTLLPGRWTP